MTANGAVDSILPDHVARAGDEAAPPRKAHGRSWPETVSFHATLLVFMLGALLVQVPTRGISADNSWHFRLARDMLSGAAVYWSAVDANRIFPDLLFSMVALLLPSGRFFSSWIYYYHAVHSLALYLSLAALALAVFDDLYRRRMFLFTAVFALTVFMVWLDFWGFWLLVPGNHGAGLPIAFLCLAILFAMSRRGVVNGPGAAAFVAMIALVIASNRLLLISFVAPLFLSLIIGFAFRRRDQARSQRSGLADTATTLFAVLATMTAVAGLAGYVMWRVLADLSWHRLVAPGGTPNLALSWSWLVTTLNKEWAELTLALTTSYKWDIIFGFAVLIATVAAGVYVLLRAIRNRPLTIEEENRLMLASFAALSVLAAYAFTVVKTDDSGTWHYRYVAMSIAFGIVSLSALPLWFETLARPRRAFTGVTVVALTAALGAVVLIAERGYRPVLLSEATYERSVADLARLIGRHSGSSKLRGYAEYWLANDISTRSDVLQVGILDSVRPEFRFYNNNAADLCADDHFFILHSPKKNEPKRADIIAAFGEPIRVEQTPLAQHEVIDILYFDPAVLKARITDLGRANAVGLFPSFKCAR